MSKNPFQLTEYISWIFNKYQKTHKDLQKREAYRITHIGKSVDKILLDIHIVGTGKQIKYSPEDLVRDDAMLEGFSKNDIRIITFYACNNLNKPKYKIAATSFCDKIKKMIFRIKKHDSDNLTEKTAHEIFIDQNILSSLSPEDAHRVGYVCGSETILDEHEEKINLKNEKKSCKREA